MIDRLESYVRLFQAAPPEVQAVLGFAGLSAAWVGGKLAWRVSAPLRWLLGASARVVMRPATKASLGPVEKRLGHLESRVSGLAKWVAGVEEDLKSVVQAQRLAYVDRDSGSIEDLREQIQRLEDRLNVAEKAKPQPAEGPSREPQFASGGYVHWPQTGVQWTPMSASHCVSRTARGEA